MKPLERAIAIAVEAHAGQRDKAGAPYVLHPLRMMLRMETEAEMMAAVLHDVVEDGAGWTLKRLADEGIPGEVVEAVEFLTKRPDEENNYMAFIERAGKNPIALRVKLADLEDNMDLGRIAHPVEKDFVRVEKYQRAHAYLSSRIHTDESDPVQLDPVLVAAKKMVAAINGEGPKCEPVTVCKRTDGRYEVLDGHDTLQAARLAGWTKVAVRVVERN